MFIYPYNEILPKKKAHDTFLFHEIASLVKKGKEVTLLCGKGKYTSDELFQHYGVEENSLFHLHFLSLIRKNNPFNISWNFPFFFASQQFLKKKREAIVILSVLKEADYHLKRKLPGCRYIYEAHELAYYPDRSFDPQKLKMEKRVLSACDLCLVTTSAMLEILRKPPYSLAIPISVIPLAVHAKALPPPQENSSPLRLFYVGQLYPEQGIALLLEALHRVSGVQLTLIGGKPEEMAAFKKMASLKHLNDRIEFLGFQAPSQLPSLLSQADAFVAPFQAIGRMPFVAHTKLYEYASWGRPFIAPHLCIVHEEFNKGVIFFEPDDPFSLAKAIEQMKEPNHRAQLQKEIKRYSDQFSWEKRAERMILEMKNLKSI